MTQFSIADIMYTPTEYKTPYQAARAFHAALSKHVVDCLGEDEADHVTITKNVNRDRPNSWTVRWPSSPEWGVVASMCWAFNKGRWYTETNDGLDLIFGKV